MPVKKTHHEQKEKKEPGLEVIKQPSQVERALIENSISLQKVLTNMAIKLDSLSDQISKLLELFEISAKSFAEKDLISEAQNHRQIIEKLDKLIEQNEKMVEGVGEASKEAYDARWEESNNEEEYQKSGELEDNSEEEPYNENKSDGGEGEYYSEAKKYRNTGYKPLPKY